MSHPCNLCFNNMRHVYFVNYFFFLIFKGVRQNSEPWVQRVPKAKGFQRNILPLQNTPSVLYYEKRIKQEAAQTVQPVTPQLPDPTQNNGNQPVPPTEGDHPFAAHYLIKKPIPATPATTMGDAVLLANVL